MRRLIFVSIASWCLLTQTARAVPSACPISIERYFQIGAGTTKGLVEYELTLKAANSGVSEVSVVATGTTKQRTGVFDADFVADDVEPRGLVVTLLFPWEQGNAPRVALAGLGEFCGDETVLQPSGIAPSPAPFEDRAVVLDPNLDISIVSPVHLIRIVAPQYSDQAKEERMEGAVDIAVMVGAGGSATNAWVYQSSHFAVLDNAALAAARASKFTEPQSGGKPVAAAYIIEYEFQL